jgi:hypothetical protein
LSEIAGRMTQSAAKPGSFKSQILLNFVEGFASRLAAPLSGTSVEGFGTFVPFSIIELTINVTSEQFLGEGCPGASSLNTRGAC